MSRVSKVLFLLLTALLMTTFVATVPSSLGAAAKKKKKKEEKVEEKKDDKKEEKKEEKKPEPFKPDIPDGEFKFGEKEKSAWAFDVAFGPDGKTVAASYRNNTVRIWDLGQKKDIQTLKTAPDAIGVGEFKSLLYRDNQILVASGRLTKVKEKDKEKKVREGEIKTWDVKSGKAGPSFTGHTLNVEALAASKDGKFIASGSEDTTVKIWDASGKETQTIKGHTEKVVSVAFSPDGKQLVTTSTDKTLRVWDIAGAKEIAQFKVEKEVETTDPKSKKTTKTKELGREFTCALFTPDGKRVIAGNLDGAIKVFDVSDKKEVKELKAHEGIWALALSPDGTHLASGGYDGTIKIWNVADFKDVRTIKAHLSANDKALPGTVTSLAFSPDGQRLASAGVDGLVKIWSVKGK